MTKKHTERHARTGGHRILKGVLIALLSAAVAVGGVFGVVLGLYYSGRGSLLGPGGANP